jgi:microcystin-dependent protein
MSTPFLGEIRLFSFVFPPKGWALCNGQLLQIAQNQALFAILGTVYGGNGSTTFALPDLRGRVPIHFNGQFPLGNTGGEESHALTLPELPAHTHAVTASSNVPDQAGPVTGPNRNFWPNGGGAIPYADTPDAAMGPQAILAAGGGQGHENRAPLLVVSFCIALAGIFPTQN